MLNRNLKIPNANSFEDPEELINYISKTLNSGFSLEPNKKIDDVKYDFLVNPVSLQYRSSLASIAANTTIKFDLLVTDNRNNGNITASSFFFLSPRDSLYSVGIYANTSGVTTGAWIAQVTKPNGTVIQYVIATNAIQIISESRDIYLEKGSKLSIINTVARTVVALGTAGYNGIELSVSQRGI